MSEQLKDQLKERIVRRLDGLPDDRLLQVLDYVEFLESKYGARAAPDNLLSRLTDTVQDTMRAGKLPLDAISGTVGFIDGASKVMKGVVSAAATVVDEATKTAQNLATPKPPAGPPAGTPEPPTPPSTGSSS